MKISSLIPPRRTLCDTIITMASFEEFDALPVAEEASVRPYWRDQEAQEVQGEEESYRFCRPPTADGPRHEEAPTLVVSFSGLGLPGKGVQFEFGKALAEFSHAYKLFVRDRDLLWFMSRRDYYRELIAAAIQDAEGVDSSAPVRLVFVGNSAGAYAALFFHKHHFPQAHVLAISPQAFLSARLRKFHEDRRWKPYVDFLNADFLKGEAESSGDSSYASFEFADPELVALLLEVPVGRSAELKAGEVLEKVGQPQKAEAKASANRHRAHRLVQYRLGAHSTERPRVEVHYNVHHRLDAVHAAAYRRWGWRDGAEEPAHAAAGSSAPQPTTCGIADEAAFLSEGGIGGRCRVVPHDGPSAFKFLDLTRKADATLDGLIHEAPYANGAGAHALAIRLRDSGQLAELLRSFVMGSESATRGALGVAEPGASAATVASSHSTPNPPPSSSPPPIVEAVEVGSTTAYILNLAALKSAHATHGCYPSVAVCAMRSAVSGAGFIMVRPEPEATGAGANASSSCSCAIGRPVAASAATACYKQLRALLDTDEATKSSWSCAAAKAQGLLGGCLAGNGGDYNCDSYRCAVEQPLEHYGYTRGSASVALDEVEDEEPRGRYKQHLWPPLANFREDVEGYAAATVSLAHTVLGVLEEALALPKGT